MFAKIVKSMRRPAPEVARYRVRAWAWQAQRVTQLLVNATGRDAIAIHRMVLGTGFLCLQAYWEISFRDVVELDHWLPIFERAANTKLIVPAPISWP